MRVGRRPVKVQTYEESIAPAMNPEEDIEHRLEKIQSKCLALDAIQREEQMGPDNRLHQKIWAKLQKDAGIRRKNKLRLVTGFLYGAAFGCSGCFMEDCNDTTDKFSCMILGVFAGGAVASCANAVISWINNVGVLPNMLFDGLETEIF